MHNFAVDMAWIPTPIIVRRQWPEITFGDHRAITFEEHKRIVEREHNPERRAYYEICWHFGGAQGDMAQLCAENVNWRQKTISYIRQKTNSPAKLKLGTHAEQVLRTLPTKGPLFPNLRTVRSSDRATEFKQRCKPLGIDGVTLHSYRYAWAERAKTVGYPERYAQEALGHNSKAVHRSYARNADVILPSLEKFEEELEKKTAGEIH
jgi:integrase